MSDKIFLDTNVIVYAFDKSDEEKNGKAKALLVELYEKQDYVISTQVVQEFCNVALRKMQPVLTEEQITTFVSTFPENKVETIDMPAVVKALEIKKRYGLAFWDSLIVSSALLSGCTILYTEDMSSGLTIENLTIRNPFD